MMDSIKQADIVISTAGREKGKPFLVYAADENHVFLVDGRYRKLEHPKCKNKKHVCFASKSDEWIEQKFKQGDVTNRDIRSLLKALKDANAAAMQV